MNYPRETFQVSTSIWDKDLKGLFDYEIFNKKLATSNFYVSNHCKVYRDNTHNTNYYRPGDYKLNEHFKFVCQLDAQKDESGSTCWLRVKETKQKQPAKNIPYLVVKTNKKQAQPLAIGDIIKIGTVQFTVMQMNTENGLQTLFDKDIANLKHLGQVYYIQKRVKQGIPKNQMEQTKSNKQEKVEIQQKSQKNQQAKKQKKIKKSKKLKFREAKKENQQLIECTKLQNDENRIHNGINESQMQDQNNESSEIENNIQIQEDHENQNWANLEHHLLKPAQKQDVSITEAVKKEQPRRCRICLMEEQSVENPFISPCSCKGSCAVIHIDCLLQWITTNTSITASKSVVNYQLSSACCQICKHSFPKIIKNGNNNIPLIKFTVPKTPYIILQKYQTQQSLTKSRQFVMIRVQNSKCFSIGRGENSHISLQNISVSRDHSEIFYYKNQFFIRDKKSKFGTLLQIQKDIRFDRDGVNLQFGRCLYKFKHLPGSMSSQQYLGWEKLN